MKDPAPAEAPRTQGIWKRLRDRVHQPFESAGPHYWDEIQAELRNSRDRLLSDWTEGAPHETLSSLDELPESAQAVLLTDAGHLEGTHSSIDDLAEACARLADSKVQALWISLESRHRAIRGLLGHSSQENDRTES